MVGVNGTGKTTTTAKLARRLQREGRKVLLAAADTYRAGAIAQLQVWADRLGLPCVAGEPGGDPGVGGVQRHRRRRVPRAAIPSSSTRPAASTPRKGSWRSFGRSSGSLGRRVPGAPHETLLVLDGTVGQNAVQQGKLFAQAVNPTGIVVTKLDGSARGGAVAALRRELDLPIRFLGVGEGLDDLQPFDAQRFAAHLLSESRANPAEGLTTETPRAQRIHREPMGVNGTPTRSCRWARRALPVSVVRRAAGGTPD